MSSKNTQGFQQVAGFILALISSIWAIVFLSIIMAGVREFGYVLVFLAALYATLAGVELFRHGSEWARVSLLVFAWIYMAGGILITVLVGSGLIGMIPGFTHKDMASAGWVFLVIGLFKFAVPGTLILWVLRHCKSNGQEVV